LRRARYYEVRRYPAHIAAETNYDKRPEGYDRLGSYCGGSNEMNSKVKFFSPTLMKIEDSNQGRNKVMSWPLLYNVPGRPSPQISDLPISTIPSVKLIEKPERVVAVLRFEAAATEPVVRKCTEQLLTLIERDGMSAARSANEGTCIVGQFDALFSLNKRRNEVWIDLESHPWL
jgi:hypothetical protein